MSDGGIRGVSSVPQTPKQRAGGNNSAGGQWGSQLKMPAAKPASSTANNLNLQLERAPKNTITNSGKLLGKQNNTGNQKTGRKQRKGQSGLIGSDYESDLLDVFADPDDDRDDRGRDRDELDQLLRHASPEQIRQYLSQFENQMKSHLNGWGSGNIDYGDLIDLLMSR